MVQLGEKVEMENGMWQVESLQKRHNYLQDAGRIVANWKAIKN